MQQVDGGLLVVSLNVQTMRGDMKNSGGTGKGKEGKGRRKGSHPGRGVSAIEEQRGMVAQSKYQRIVVTEWQDHYWLYLNGNEQFSSYDEERYHEPLVHPALQITSNRENILILGGGDGLAAREILKYPDVKNLTLVDIDPIMTNLGKTYPVFVNLNDGSLLNSKVKIIYLKYVL